MDKFEMISKMGFDCLKTKEFFENNREMKKENYLKCPDWMEPEYDDAGNYEETPDGLYPLFDPFLQRRFFERGRVAIGAMLQANMLLFKRGRDNCPAAYIYSTEKYYMENPEELRVLAYAIVSTKGERGYRPSIQKIADLLADELERAFCWKLPRDLTEGRDVFLSTIFVDRRHLPKKRIVHRMAPMLVLADSTPDAMILPHWYWKS